jgi:hypothetical protein
VKALIAALRRALSLKMTAKQYFVYQSLGSILVNGVLTAGFAWLKRSMQVVPLWGRSGIARDTLVTTFMLSASTVLFGTFSIHRDYKAGRFPMMTWTPKNHRVLRLFSHTTILRAMAFGPLFTAVLVPPTLGVFVLAHVHELRFWPFVAFKILYAVILGMAVTPLNALWVLTRSGRASGDATVHGSA